MESYAEYVKDLDCEVLIPLGNTNGLTDLSGNGRDGTAAGGLTVGGVDGPLFRDEGATDFDGSNDRITTPYGPFVNGSTLTFMGWAKRDTNGGYQTLVGGTGATSPILFVSIGSNFFRWRCGDPVADVTLGDVPAPGTWFHFAVVVDEAGNTVEGFINGVSLGVKAMSQAYGGTPGNFMIGAYTSTSSPFDGKLAWVSAHERALTANEIKTAYELAVGEYLDINIDNINFNNSLSIQNYNAKIDVQQYSTAIDILGD